MAGNSSGPVLDSPRKNDDHVIATARATATISQKKTAQLRSRQTKDFVRGDFARAWPGRSDLRRRKTEQPPVAHAQLARRELVHDDAFACEAGGVLLQERPRRERTVRVLDEAIDGPLQDVTQVLDESSRTARP